MCAKSSNSGKIVNNIDESEKKIMKSKERKINNKNWFFGFLFLNS
jgi:hypothetical protein